MKLSSLDRRLVAEHAGDEPAHGLDDDEGGQLAAGEHVVADRELAVDKVVAIRWSTPS